MEKKQINILEDIKSGYLVELRNGEKYLCLRHNQSKFDKLLVNTLIGKICGLVSYDDSFYSITPDRGMDIYRIYGLPNDTNTYICTSALYSGNHRPLLWERKPVEMTKEQIEKKLGYKIKIVVE